MDDSSDSQSVFGDLAGEVGRAVYIPDPVEGYRPGKLVDFHVHGLKVQLAKKDVVCVPHDDVLPAEEDASRDVDDSCALMYLNEATLLDNCRRRYTRKQIYTYVANVLIAINPYEVVPGLYSEDTVALYHGRSLGVLPPHIFAIADHARRELRRTKQNQSIVVSGESGGGKTESQKHILRYLCDQREASVGQIEQRLLKANSVLEAFGNARTKRNNNSSRFGKFVQIHFDEECTVAGGFVSHYLLEKSRLCQQSPGERNYHIFYQLIAGTDEELSEALHLGPPADFHYLNGNPQFFASPQTFPKIPIRCRRQEGYLTDNLVDDYTNFQVLKNALTDIGFDESRRESLFSIIAGILHLGNVQFTDADDIRCCVDSTSTTSLAVAAKLLGLAVEDLERELTSRVIESRVSKNGTVISVPLRPSGARAARDALAKAIYSRLFDSVVTAINESLPSAASLGFIGVLDVAGFECFEVNSFEQFCINYCNEKLQQFFNDRILKQEQELYRREALAVPEVEFVDNQDCVEVFEGKGTGLLDLLDEEARLPNGSAVHFTAEVHRHYAQHVRMAPPRRSGIREHREMRDDEGFLIRHYVGAVCYQTGHFLQKNNDALHISLEMIVGISQNPYLRSLFPAAAMDSRTVGSNSRAKLVRSSVGSKFRSQLSSLMKKLKGTGTHFVRCIKPNSEMEPNKFEGARILSQLRCAGMGSVLKLMHCGFPSRASFNDLHTNYGMFLPEELKRLDPRLFCKCLFHALGLSESDFQFGLTKAFFRTGKFAEFDQLMHRDEKETTGLVRKVQSWLNRTRWQKLLSVITSCSRINQIIGDRRKLYTKVQAVVRGHLVRRKVLPQLTALRDLNSLNERFNEIRELVQGVSDTMRRKELGEQLMEFKTAMEDLLENIREDPWESDPRMVGNVKELENEVDGLAGGLRGEIAEGSARLQIMEAGTRHQEGRREEGDTFVGAECDLKLEEKMVHLLDEEGPEKVGRELACRVAREGNSVSVEEIPWKKPEMGSESTPVSNDKEHREKLSKLTHAELRTVLNATNDHELLKACQAEFHRRLRFFSGWRLKHRKANNLDDIHRSESPTGLGVKPALSLPPLLLCQHSAANRSERFFRTPLCNRKRTCPGAAAEAGFWYSHFAGELVVREILLRPKESPVLMVAGKDDMHMTHGLLWETGLLMRDCEMKKQEFEAAWLRFGGSPVNTYFN